MRTHLRQEPQVQEYRRQRRQLAQHVRDRQRQPHGESRVRQDARQQPDAWYQYDALPEMAWRGRSYSKQQIRPLIELANSFGVEVIPMTNHLGHASQSRGWAGKHTVLDQNPRLSTLFEPDGWTWCLSNPDTYGLLGDMRAELIEFCGPGKYFHLGFDEA